MKIHSHPPGRCLKATLWTCYDLAIENKNKLEQNSENSPSTHGLHRPDVNTPLPEAEKRSQKQQSTKQDEVLNLTLQRIRRAAASVHSGKSDSSATTPRTCKCSSNYEWSIVCVISLVAYLNRRLLAV